MVNIRIGHGYDVHRLVLDRKLILGGVEIKNKLGLLGHSDADVLIHAVMDSLLGGAALGDIGKYFPDTDAYYRDASSIKLLSEVKDMLSANGFELVNIDATVLAQAPKLRPYIDNMRKNLSDTLQIPLDCVSVKATTEEGLGFTGSLDGIAAHCICLLNKTV